MGYRAELGGTIKDARVRAGLSQGQLGSAAGVSAQQVSRWERAQAIPGRAALAKVADALDLDWRALNDLAMDAGEEELKATRTERDRLKDDLVATTARLERLIAQLEPLVRKLGGPTD